MNREIQKGTRRKICTGCGRCFGRTDSIQVVKEFQKEGFFITPLICREEYIVLADIGTTTIAMVLYDPKGQELDQFLKVNPQTYYGADIMSRISAAENNMNAGMMRKMVMGTLEEGLKQFEHKIRELNLEEVLEKEAGEEADRKVKLYLAGNTTMIYLLMGLQTAELGASPFHASHLETLNTKICGVDTYIFSGVSAFVGGDIVAGMYAGGMFEQKEITLLVDLGTNGEIALGNNEKRISCSTAAGPAFEGGANKGIWGADMISLVSRLLQEGIVDQDGLLAEPYFEEGITIGNVLITQQTIRQLQLAKAAIAVGIDLLLEKYGIEACQVEKVILAGGFGYYLKPEDAAKIGLLNPELARIAKSGGNTALAGAYKLAFGNRDEKEAQKIVEQGARQTESMNIAQMPDFGGKYLNKLELKS